MKNRYATWSEAQQALLNLGIRSAHEYMRRYREDARLPPNPYDEYADHESISTFFRVTRRTSFYTTWQEASKAAIALGIRGQVAYKKNYHKDPLLPSQPYTAYDDFPGWGKFLKTGNLSHHIRIAEIYESRDDAAKAAQALMIKSRVEYESRYKEDKRLPMHPQRRYKDGWPGWPVFLGKKPSSAGVQSSET